VHLDGLHVSRFMLDNALDWLIVIIDTDGFGDCVCVTNDVEDDDEDGSCDTTAYWKPHDFGDSNSFDFADNYELANSVEIGDNICIRDCGWCVAVEYRIAICGVVAVGDAVKHGDAVEIPYDVEDGVGNDDELALEHGVALPDAI
jgi:hypothetical protein